MKIVFFLETRYVVSDLLKFLYAENLFGDFVRRLCLDELAARAVASMGLQS